MSDRITYVQIGWTTVPADEIDVENFDVLMDCSNLDEYDGTESIHHSHGPISTPLPIFVAVPRG